MYTDLYRAKKADFRLSRPQGIIITHSVDLFLKGDIDSRVRHDSYKPSFHIFSKYTWGRLKLDRFPSHYFIEQIEDEVCTIVGTGLQMSSSYLNKYIAKDETTLNDFIFIVIAGDYSDFIIPDDIYKRLGNLISSILYTYKMNGKIINVHTLSDIVSLFDLDPHKEVELKPMTKFKREELSLYVK